MRATLVLTLLALVVAGCGGGGKKTAATTTTRPAATTSSFSGIASAANCRQLGDLGTRFSSALSGAKEPGDLKKVARLLEEFAAKTPSDIRPDFKLLAEDYGKIADALGSFKAGTTPDPAALAKLQKLASEIDTTKLSQASQRISAWLQKNCTP